MFRFRCFFICFLCLIILNTQAQTSLYYKDAFVDIQSMLLNTDSISFKKAVFLVEDVYFDGQLDKDAFFKNIRSSAFIVDGIKNSGDILYTETDKDRASAQCATFVFFTDSIPIQINEQQMLIHAPFTYNYEDFAGHESVHTGVDNMQQQYDNENKGTNYDVEAKPLQIEQKIIDELNKKK